MERFCRYFRKNPYLVPLFGILLISLFFRTYQIIERLEYNHDGDLYSWIAKDIIVNHHPRLIGQLTSAPGIFIGPFYYYLNVPFFLLFNMDPIGATAPLTIIAILTTLSYFLVFSKLFNNTVGLISSFFHATLFTSVSFDRWIVPSTPANIWSVWYFYTVVKISRGDFSVLPLLGILTGLIWHIHIALAPSLLAVPIAFLVSKKIPKLKQILISFVAFSITSIPLFLFEIRHNFSQTTSLLNGFTVNHGGEKGVSKLIQVIEMISKNINTLFLAPQSLPQTFSYLFTVILLMLGIILVIKKIITIKTTLPLLGWLIGVVAFFTFSSSLISEYYFYSIEIIFIGIVSLTLSKLTRALVIIILSLILIKNAFYFVNTDIYHKGYMERKAVANYITQDAKNKNYPCVGITYITTPGENVGFRYFFYLNSLHLVHPSLDIPVYNIVIPDELSNEPKKKFGHIGVIPPINIPSKETIEKSCQTPNTNLTDPMLGYVQRF